MYVCIANVARRVSVRMRAVRAVRRTFALFISTSSLVATNCTGLSPLSPDSCFGVQPVNTSLWLTATDSVSGNRVLGAVVHAVGPSSADSSSLTILTDSTLYPAKLFTPEAGSYAVSVQASGYRAWTQEVTMTWYQGAHCSVNVVSVAARLQR